MKITRGSIKEDFHRDLYWTRIYFESNDGQKTSTVLVSASEEYFWDLLHTRQFGKIELEKWLKSVIVKWESLGDDILKEKIYYDSYATTYEAKMKGIEFLQKEIEP